MLNSSTVVNLYQNLSQYATADLPAASLHEGEIVYNTTTDEVWYSNGTAWGPVGSAPEGFINPRMYGAKFDGSTNDTAALAAAETAAVAAGYGLYIPGKLRVGTSGTTTITSRVKFGPKGSFDVRTGATLALSGQIEAGVQQIFFMNGGTVTLNKSKVHVGFPEWWGAVTGSSSSDCLAGLQYAAAALPKVQLQAADYWITDTWKITTNNVEVVGAALSRPSSTVQTRIIVKSTTANTIQIGPDSDPGSINSHQHQNRLSLVEVTRDRAIVPPSPGSESTGACGVKIQYTLYTYLDKVWSSEHAIGFNLYGTVQAHLADCFAFRSTAAASGTDYFYGYYLDGTASIGLAGGNASTYVKDCNASMGGAISATGASPISSIGLNLPSAFVDTFVNGFETSAIQTGVSAVGTSGGSSGLQKTGNVDLHLHNLYIDTFTVNGLSLDSLANYAAVDVMGGYFAPSSAAGSGAAASITSSGGAVSLTNNQYICWPSSSTKGLYISSSGGVVSQGNMIVGSLTPIVLSTASNCSISDIINNPAETASQGAVYMTGSSRNYIAPVIKGGSAMFPKGIEASSTGNTYNEFNCTGIDPAALTSGSANKLVINSVQVTSTGLSGTNLVAGVMD